LLFFRLLGFVEQLYVIRFPEFMKRRKPRKQYFYQTENRGDDLENQQSVVEIQIALA
jgi:hypothetical protein